MTDDDLLDALNSLRAQNLALQCAVGALSAKLEGSEESIISIYETIAGAIQMAALQETAMDETLREIQRKALQDLRAFLAGD